MPPSPTAARLRVDFMAHQPLLDEGLLLDPYRHRTIPLAGVLGPGLTMHTRRLARLGPHLAIRTHRSGAESCLDSTDHTVTRPPTSIPHRLPTTRLFVPHSLAYCDDIPTQVWAVSQTGRLLPNKHL